MWIGGERAIPVALAPDLFGGPWPGGRAGRNMAAGSVKCRSGARISSQIRTCTNGTNVIMFDWLYFYAIFLIFGSVGFGSVGFCLFVLLLLLLDFSLLPTYNRSGWPVLSSR